MTIHSAGNDSTTSNAERGIRDLMAMLSLAALWLGKDGRTVLELMLDAVNRVVPLRFSLVEAAVLSGEAPILIGRAGDGLMDAASAATWRAAAHEWTKSAALSASSRNTKMTPLGPLHIVRLELGMSMSSGAVWFGSDTPQFPAMTELAILRAAASLAAAGLQTARMQHEREEELRLKDEFLAMLAHELRNPLAPIRSAASLLRIDNIPAPQMKRAGAVIERQVQHMASLLDDLLDVSRVSTGSIAIHKSAVNMQAVFDDAYEQTNSLFIAKQQQVEQLLASGSVLVNGDKNRLVQVIANLLSNAARYTPVGGNIVIRSAVTGDSVAISVKDDGIGIAKDMQLKIFGLFVQASRSIDRSEGGLGVGLSLARRLVELHGGIITVQSEGLGKGATFTVSLPRVHVDTHDPVVVPVFEATKSLRILLVDDHVDGAEAMAEMLRALGHSVWISHHPQDALLRAPQLRPDVFLLDIGLPGFDGYELARRLVILPELKDAMLIALTGYGQTADRQMARGAGFHHHCIKPVDMDALQQILTNIGVD